MRGYSPSLPPFRMRGLLQHPPTTKHANPMKTNALHKAQKGRFKALILVCGIPLPPRPSWLFTAVFGENNYPRKVARKQKCFILKTKIGH